MIKIIPPLLTAFLLALGLGVTSAHALNTRSFISALGNDANACTRTAPCRTLQKAHDSTNAGGEINMLDPAGYGTVVITKAISIVNDGVGSAGILVPSGGVGITVDAGVNDVVNLRGLIIEGAGVGGNGIYFNTGATLSIQNSVIRKFTQSGISFQPSVSSKLFVSNTLVSNNGGDGIEVTPFGSDITVTARLNRVELDNNASHGITANSGGSTGVTNVTVADSSAANNNNVGFQSVSSTDQAVTSVMLVRCVAVNNSIGIRAFGANATLRSAQSTVTGNATGWVATNGGALFTYGDNNIDGNTNDGGNPPTIATR